MQIEKLATIKEKLIVKINELKTLFKLHKFNIEKLKSLASTNVGIGIIASIVIIILFTLHQLHKNQDIPPIENLAAWNTSSSNEEASMPTEKNSSLHNIGHKTLQKELVDPEITVLKVQIDTLKQSLAETNERLLVLTQQIENEKKEKATKKANRKPYRLLGVHLDQSTNQWVADIQYENMVISVTSGQEFDGWQVRDVNAQGALID